MKFKIGDRVIFQHMYIDERWDNCEVIGIQSSEYPYEIKNLETEFTGIVKEEELEFLQPYYNEQKIRKLLGV